MQLSQQVPGDPTLENWTCGVPQMRA